MPCSCRNNKKNTFEVVSAAGKVLYSGTSEPTAKAVKGRYAGSTLNVKSKDGTTANT